jgi:hypothetical protein
VAIDFPASPLLNDLYTVGARTWKCVAVNPSVWRAVTTTYGPQGVQGTTGSTGLQGFTGAQGVTGAQGINGSQGTNGIQGLIGSQGPIGLQGAIGIQGTTGAQGIVGAQGAIGPQGAQGRQGLQGTTGTGIQGLTGLQGIQGIEGIGFFDTITNVTTNSAVTVATIAMNSFISVQYKITIHQNQNVRSSNVLVQKNDTTVSYSEFGITTVGSPISSVAVVAEVSGSNMILKVTIGDGATNNARVFLGRYDQISPTTPMTPTNLSVSQISGNVIVAFTANDNGGAITTYTATSTPGSVTASSSASPVTVTGLSNGTSYTFTVQGVNAYGSSPASASSSPIVPANQNYKAYFVDGYNQNSGTNVLLTTLMNLSNETFTQLSYATALGINAAGISNPGVSGYTAYSSNATTSLRKFAWPNDTVSILTGIMPSLSYSQTMGASSNIGAAGYFYGRWGGGGDNQRRTVYKFNYSSESISTNSNLIDDSPYTSNAVYAGTQNKSVAAYVSQSNTYYATYGNVFIMPFSTETWTSTSTSFGSLMGAGLSNDGVAAYWAGGVAGAYNDLIKKMTYSNNTMSSVSGTLTASVRDTTGVFNAGVAGYFGGGANGATAETPINAVTKIAFSNDTTSTLSNTLSAATSFAGGLVDN